jgi:hypothetical protein
MAVSLAAQFTRFGSIALMLDGRRTDDFTARHEKTEKWRAQRASCPGQSPSERVGDVYEQVGLMPGLNKVKPGHDAEDVTAICQIAKFNRPI